MARSDREQEGAAGEGRLLLRRAQGGDAAGFIELIRRDDERLRGLAFHLRGDRELMDDVMQRSI